MGHPIVDEMRDRLRSAADPAKAAQMQAYMKTEQSFYGVASADCDRIYREARSAYPIATEQDYASVVRELWHGQYREDMYQALRVAGGTRPFYKVDFFPLYEELVHSAAWWDTLDWIAGSIAGPLIVKDRSLEQRLIEWRTDSHMWTRRASLLAHLKHKTVTNRELLAETILLLSDEKEFFIRKAIGWVLRQFSYTDPDWVERFVEDHADVLSGLSRREAMKAIERKRGSDN